EEEALGTLRLREDSLDLFGRQDDRQLTPPLCPDQPLQLADLAFEDGAVEKEDRAEGLGLGRSADPTGHGQMGEEGVDLRLPHVPGVALSMKKDVATNPVDVGL